MIGIDSAALGKYERSDRKRRRSAVAVIGSRQNRSAVPDDKGSGYVHLRSGARLIIDPRGINRKRRAP